MTTWHRAWDRQDRLFTLARTGDRVVAYFPETEGVWFHCASGGSRRNQDDRPVSYWRDERSADTQDAWKAEYEVVGEAEAIAIPGQFFPRMYRGPEHPPIDVAARTATMRAARSLFSRLRGIFQVVEPTHAHDTVFGHELRHLLILACTEVESSWRAVLAANAHPAGRWSTNEYVKLLGPMKLDQYVVRLASHPGYGEIVPFDGWDANHPTRSLGWYDAYNHTKHNREEELHRATLLATIAAMAAVHVMTVAQFGFDEVERAHFHPDEFNFERSPTWIADAYIRPLLPPDEPLVKADGTYATWPPWGKVDYQF